MFQREDVCDPVSSHYFLPNGSLLGRRVSDVPSEAWFAMSFSTVRLSVLLEIDSPCSSSGKSHEDKVHREKVTEREIRKDTEEAARSSEDEHRNCCRAHVSRSLEAQDIDDSILPRNRGRAFI